MHIQLPAWKLLETKEEKRDERYRIAKADVTGELPSERETQEKRWPSGKPAPTCLLRFCDIAGVVVSHGIGDFLCKSTR